MLCFLQREIETASYPFLTHCYCQHFHHLFYRFYRIYRHKCEQSSVNAANGHFGVMTVKIVSDSYKLMMPAFPHFPIHYGFPV